MSITDELREYVRHYSVAGSSKDKTLTAIADRIDAAHRSALEKLAAQLDETSDMREFCGRLEEAATNREDVTLWGIDYIPLPVDADGVPIRVGDVMEFSAFDLEHPVTRTVDGLGQDIFFAWCGERGYQQHDVKRYRHHPPTVEDVLREFADRVCNSGHQWGLDAADTIAEFAAKLRLAGEDE